MLCNRDFTLEYTCFVEHQNFDSPNIRIKKIIAKHAAGKSDDDVHSVFFKKSNLAFIPTFDDGYLTRKFPKLEKVFVDGHDSLVPLSFNSDSIIVPSYVREFSLRNFGDKFTQIPHGLLGNRPHLKNIWIFGNEITEIPAKLFNENKILEFVIQYWRKSISFFAS